MKKYSRAHQRALATCAVYCAARVMPLFDRACPGDERPRQAILACRTWIRTGVFKMADIRGASLAAHAAARAAGDNAPARFAARSAGQAVAAAHVPQHAFGAAYYALKAIAATPTSNCGARLRRELTLQSRQLPRELRPEFRQRVVFSESGGRMIIKIQKGPGF